MTGLHELFGKDLRHQFIIPCVSIIHVKRTRFNFSCNILLLLFILCSCFTDKVAVLTLAVSWDVVKAVMGIVSTLSSTLTG